MDSDDKFVYDGGSIYLRQKELRFFDRNWDKGVDWYRSLFAEGTVVGDGSVSYFYDQTAMQRMYETVPNTKMIILLRNPIDRLNSHYHHFKNISDKFANKHPSLKSFLEAELHSGHQVVDRGIYVKSLREYFKRFTKEQTLVVRSEDLFINPEATVGEILDHLKVTQIKLEYKNFRRSNPKPLPEHTRKILSDFYRPYNKELCNFLGRDMQWD
jgi:hypothetical protein